MTDTPLAAGPVRQPWATVRRAAADKLPLHVVLLTLGIALQVTSGHGAYFFHVGVPVDRLLVVAGLGALVVHLLQRGVTLRARPVHLAMVALVGWVAASIVWSRPESTRDAVFALVDAVGVVPFVVLVLAPVVWSTPSRRRFLAYVLTGLGLYLGVTALLEGLGLYELVWPRYIFDPTSPHFGRAGGPSTQVASNGLQMLACGVAATSLLLSETVGRAWRCVAGVVVVLTVLGGFLTLTRSVWIGYVAGIGLALWVSGVGRRAVVLAFATLSGALTVLLLNVPGLRDLVLARLDDRASGFDRLNATSAAVDAFLAHPLAGIGYHTFAEKEVLWLWQDPDRPLAATGIAVHNMLLGYATEIGAVGLALWLLVAGLAAHLVWRSRPLPGREGRVWRIGALAYVVAWLTVGMLVPMTYQQPATFVALLVGLLIDPDRLGWQWPPDDGGRP